MVAPGAEQIVLVNPIASQMGVMRGSLWPGLLATLKHNLNHGQERLRLFELGRCYLGTDSQAQPLRLGGLAYGTVRPEQWGEAGRLVDFFDIKGDLEALLAPATLECDADAHPMLHPGQTARLRVSGQPLGWLGSLHPQHVQTLGLTRVPILFELDWASLNQGILPGYQAVSRFPAVRRDLAIVVDASLAVGAILATIKANLPAHVSDFALFDLYQGQGVEAGKKSLAFSILLQDTQKTLTDLEIDSAVSQVIKILAERFNAVLRT